MNLWENIKNLFTRPVSESIDSEDSGYTKLGDDDGKNLDINSQVYSLNPNIFVYLNNFSVT